MSENIVFLRLVAIPAGGQQLFSIASIFLSHHLPEKVAKHCSSGGYLAREIPFITTDVPGCRVLAQEFDCPAVKMSEFCDKALEIAARQMKMSTVGWKYKILPFLAEQVEQEFFEHLYATAKAKSCNSDGVKPKE